MDDQSQDQKDAQGGQSGAGYGDQGQGDLAPADGGGMDSSGGHGGSGSEGGSGQPEGVPGDQSIQRSETIEAEDIEFEIDRDGIDVDDA